MKNFVTLLIILLTIDSYCQNIRLKIIPLDDSSEHREHYYSIYNNSSYAFLFTNENNDIIENYTDSFKIFTDTNYILINDVYLIAKNVIGVTTLKVYSSDGKKLILKMDLKLVRREVISININIEKLKEERVIKAELYDEKGIMCTEKYKCGYIIFNLIDNNGKKIYSEIEINWETKIPESTVVKDIKYILIETLLVYRESGLVLRVVDSKIDVNNNH